MKKGPLSDGFLSKDIRGCFLPYSEKRKQLFKMTFLGNEQTVSVMYIDINAISLYLDLNIFQQDECFCSKLLQMEVEYGKSNLKISLSQIWVICQLLPSVIVGLFLWKLCLMFFVVVFWPHQGIYCLHNSTFKITLQMNEKDDTFLTFTDK